MTNTESEPFEVDEPSNWARLSDLDVTPKGWIRIEQINRGDELIVQADLPGVDPDRDVEVSVADDVLHLTATRRPPPAPGGGEVVRSEFCYGPLRRDLALPPGVDVSSVAADYRAGVLEVRLRLGHEPDVATRHVAIGRG